MPMRISRRNLIATTSAGITATAMAGSPAAFAQDKPTITVGSKDFTEQLIIGEIVAQLLENDGFPVERQLNLGGSLVAHEALLNGDIDTYVEYTGTGLIAMLGQELPEREADVGSTDASSATPGAIGGYADTVYNVVADAYPEEFGVEWLEPWGFNNTFALAMRREHAEELGVTSISDLMPLSNDLSIGANAETIAREDGIPGLEETYDLDFGDVVSLDAGLMYTAVNEEEVDVIAAFATDGRIESMDLVLLEDDREFFPPYHAAPVVRQDTLEQAPEIREVLNSLAGQIDDARMTEMNFLADDEGREPVEIARNFLIEEGIVEDE